MLKSLELNAADVRAKVSHPIVDGDGHILEARLTILDYVKKIAGPEVALRYENLESPWKYQDCQQIFWGMPSGPQSLDRATAMLPKLYQTQPWRWRPYASRSAAGSLSRSNASRIEGFCRMRITRSWKPVNSVASETCSLKDWF